MDCIAIQSLCPRHSQAGCWTGRWARGWASRQALGVGAGALGSAQQMRGHGTDARGAHDRRRQARGSRLERTGLAGSSSARARGATGARA